MNEVGPLLSIKKIKQLLRYFEGWKFKKFKQFEGWGMGQVTHKSVVFQYIISTVQQYLWHMASFFEELFVNAGKIINFLNKYPSNQ